jgi:hypothetical protein
MLLVRTPGTRHESALSSCAESKERPHEEADDREPIPEWTQCVAANEQHDPEQRDHCSAHIASPRRTTKSSLKGLLSVGGDIQRTDRCVAPALALGVLRAHRGTDAMHACGADPGGVLCCPVWKLFSHSRDDRPPHHGRFETNARLRAQVERKRSGSAVRASHLWWRRGGAHLAGISARSPGRRSNA